MIIANKHEHKKDIEECHRAGTIRYGQRLRPHNGRDPLIDLYQEMMDGLVYLRQALYEKYAE